MCWIFSSLKRIILKIISYFRAFALIRVLGKCFYHRVAQGSWLSLYRFKHVIIIWYLQKWVLKVGTGLNWVRLQLSGFCDNADEYSCCVRRNVTLLFAVWDEEDSLLMQCRWRWRLESSEMFTLYRRVNIYRSSFDMSVALSPDTLSNPGRLEYSELRLWYRHMLHPSERPWPYQYLLKERDF